MAFMAHSCVTPCSQPCCNCCRKGHSGSGATLDVPFCLYCDIQLLSTTMQQTRSIHTTTPQASKPQVFPAPRKRPGSKQHRPFSSAHTSASPRPASTSNDSSTAVTKRQLLSGTTAAVLASVIAPAWQQQPAQAQSLDDDFTITSSGLKVLDVRPGEGATPQPGDTVVVHWSGYTKGYQVCSLLAANGIAGGQHCLTVCFRQPL